MEFRAPPATAPLKLLWINPVTIPDYDQPIADLIGQVKMPATEAHVVSLDLGDIRLTNVEHRAAEAAIWFPVTRITRWASENGFDGCSIGCFYDTALDEAREVSGDMVVCGPCQGALHIISILCNRFSIVIGHEKWKVQMEERVRHYGYGGRLASFRTLGLGVDDFQADKAHTEGRIRDAVAKAIAEDKAEGIILGCTLEFGFFHQLQEEFGVPVIDAVYAGFKSTEQAAASKRQLGWGPSRRWSGQPLSPEALASSGLFAGDPPIKNCVIAPRS